MIAAAITTTRTAGSVTCPSLAATPARRATVSPGSTNPTKRASSAATSRPATTSTVQPGNPRRRSTTALTARGPRTTATAGRRSRAMPAEGRHGDGRGDPSPAMDSDQAPACWGQIVAVESWMKFSASAAVAPELMNAWTSCSWLISPSSAVQASRAIASCSSSVAGGAIPDAATTSRNTEFAVSPGGISTVFAAVVDGTAELVVEGAVSLVGAGAEEGAARVGGAQEGGGCVGAG